MCKLSAKLPAKSRQCKRTLKHDLSGALLRLSSLFCKFWKGKRLLLLPRTLDKKLYNFDHSAIWKDDYVVNKNVFRAASHRGRIGLEKLRSKSRRGRCRYLWFRKEPAQKRYCIIGNRQKWIWHRQSGDRCAEADGKPWLKLGLYCQRFTQSRQWQAPCWPWCVETKMKTILSVLSLHKEEKFVSPESGKWQKNMNFKLT